MRQNNRHAVHRPGLLARPGGRPALPPPSLPASAQPAASCLTDIFPLFMQLVFGTRGRYKEKESEEKHRFSSPQKVLCIKPTTARPEEGEKKKKALGTKKTLPSIHSFSSFLPSSFLPFLLASFISVRLRPVIPRGRKWRSTVKAGHRLASRARSPPRSALERSS